jgi:hypothetical protein
MRWICASVSSGLDRDQGEQAGADRADDRIVHGHRGGSHALDEAEHAGSLTRVAG